MSLKNLYQKMAGMAEGSALTLPPKSAEEMEAEIIDYVEDESIAVKFPLYEKYNNPAGLILGGYFPFFFDLSFGPLSYLVAKKPTASLDLNTTFIRPVTVKDNELTVKASVINKSKSYIIFEGRAFNSKNDLVATATSRMVILG